MHRMIFLCVVGSLVLAQDAARASNPTADPGNPAPADPDPAASNAPRAELIEVTGSAPVPPGTISLDAQTARQTAGALGEPFRALALLPGVTTSIAASGYPVIRGALPGESRYTFDGIEIPMLYHLLLGNQVIHPSFIGDLELRAGGHGPEQGNLIGGLIAMTPAAIDAPRTELRANPIEIGAFHAQRLSDTTSIAAAARFGTLAGPVKLYDSSAALYTIDQQTRLVHKLDSGDRLTLTSLGAYDYLRQPPDGTRTRSDRLGFHRLDGRWTRTRAGEQLRAGVETALDILEDTSVPLPVFMPDGTPFPQHTTRQGGHAYGIRGYADAGLALASWLTARAGVEARHRTLINGEDPFKLSPVADPFVGPARRVDAGGAWTALELRAGPLRFSPGVRVDAYHAELYGAAVGHVAVDPRLAVDADLPGGARARLAGGAYTAPPQASVYAGNVVIGPLPMLDGAASAAGVNHGVEAELSLRAPLGAGLQGSLAGYYRQTHEAVDFSMLQAPLGGGYTCPGPLPMGPLPSAYVYRNIDTRAVGIEAMVRGELGRSVTGWVSYSLAKIDRDLGFLQLPGEFDQRHTLNATAQWTRGRWRFGASGHLHTGRPVPYPQITRCSGSDVDAVIQRADVVRPLPTSYRVDLRAERAFEAGSWHMRLFFELQNATLTPEAIGYTTAPVAPVAPGSPREQVVADTLFLPLPLIGLEVVL